MLARQCVAWQLRQGRSSQQQHLALVRWLADKADDDKGGLMAKIWGWV